MWHVRQALNFALGLLGAMILAAAVAAVPARGSHYLRTVAARLVDFVHLDFGISSISGAPAGALVVQCLPATFELMAAGALIAVLSGAPLGVLLGRGRALRAAAPLIQFVAAAPVFCAGLGLMWLAARVLHWTYVPRPLPWPALSQGGHTAVMALEALALPALTVGAAGAAAVQLAVRRAESAAIEEPYRQGLRLLGLGSFEIDRLYLAPQVFAGALSSFGEIVLALFSAAAVAEWLFGWPGAAVLFLKSVALHDWNVTALVLFAFAAVSLLADFCGIVAARALGGASFA
jgi:peptide/nickel transport system permease protein